jgi:putative ATP-dependent endonuclease of OLD family
MKLTRLRLSNFQCFGPDPSTIDLAPITFLLGPNGAGKTAVHHALVRLFGMAGSLQRVRSSDFHVTPKEAAHRPSEPRELWLEAQFEFPETRKSTGKHATIPPNPSLTVPVGFALVRPS